MNIIADNKDIQNQLLCFLDKYGINGLEQALKLYTDMQQEYTCTTRKKYSKIKVGEIYYLKISGHNINIFTSNGIYKKYGTLIKELKFLEQFGFIRCNQSYAVAISKIQGVIQNQIIMENGDRIPMSRNYARKLLIALHNV